jgi:hypothetical protein
MPSSATGGATGTGRPHAPAALSIAAMVRTDSLAAPSLAVAGHAGPGVSAAEACSAERAEAALGPPTGELERARDLLDAFLLERAQEKMAER